MAWSTPTTFVAGDVLTAAQLNANIKDNFAAVFVTPTDPTAAWTAFTPTLSNGWALGNSTYTATYCKIGRLVIFHVVITIGSTATKGTGLDMALPVTAVSASSVIAGCRWIAQDVGTAQVPGFVGFETTTTVLKLYAMNVAGTYAAGDVCTASVPFTWATGDLIVVGGTYEAAS